MGGLQSMEKSAMVLDLFSRRHPEWGVGEASRALGFPKSTTSWVMSNLARHRFLRRVGKGRYRLGWRLFELGQTLLDTTEFRLQARGVMQDLVERHNETVQLAVLDGVYAVYVEKIQPKPAVRIDFSYVGIRLPAYCTGLGKVLLADRGWDEISPALADAGMPAITPNTITDLDALREELERVRERGYALDDEESVIGLGCVAAPVFGPRGEGEEEGVVAAVSISVPAYRFETSRATYTAAILDAARRISPGAAPARR